MDAFSIVSRIFDLRCILCNEKKLLPRLPFICEKCYSMFDLHLENACATCGHPLDESGKCPSCRKIGEIHFDSFSFIQYYTEFFKTIVYKWKIQENFLVNRLFLELLLDKHLMDPEIPVTAVPDTPLKNMRRGRCGLSHLLKLLKKKGYKVYNGIFKRKFALGKPQKEKSMLQRFEQIRKNYYLPRKNIGRYAGEIYLLDDIFTSGATANYGAELLKKAGFKKVNVVSFFRAKLGEYL